MAYEIEFATAVERHLRSLSAGQRRIVFEGIAVQLRDQRTVASRKRKPMRPNPLAPWELRLGDLRVYYRVLEDPTKTVQIAAVGIKKRERIWMAGERVEL